MAQRIGNITAGVLSRALSARSAARQISTEISSADLFVGAQGTCERCGDLVVYKELTGGGHTIRLWSDCTCWGLAVDRASQLSAHSVAADAGRLLEPEISDVRPIQRFTLDTFDPARLVSGDKLRRAAERWLTSIDGMPSGDYHAGPAVALYFYSAGKGRGKTHLAGAMAMDAHRRGKLVAFADEIGYVDRLWSLDLEKRASLTQLAGDRAWLTVLDDLGARENTPAGLRDAWYGVINPRWLKCGWTIFTSNFTPEELVERQTLDDRSYSRLKQMTGGKIIPFEGSDQRLVEHEAAA